MKKCISLTTENNQIILKVEENATEKDVLDSLEKNLSKLKKLYKDNNFPVFIKGREFSSEECKEIEAILQNSIEDIQITFELPKMLGLHGIKKSFNKEIAISETKYHRGALRSGQKIEFEGSVVVLGDVNGGAEVIAGENIVVLGILRGLAHAGANGNKEAIISSCSIESPQIRISNIIKERNRLEILDKKIKTIAYVDEGGQIIIE